MRMEWIVFGEKCKVESTFSKKTTMPGFKTEIESYVFFLFLDFCRQRSFKIETGFLI